MQYKHKVHGAASNVHWTKFSHLIDAAANHTHSFHLQQCQTACYPILCEKFLQHQQDLCHVFINFKKAFDRVWHAPLWATMKKYNTSTNLILYDKATSAVFLNSSIGEQQLESDKDVYSHPRSSTYFWVKKDHYRCFRRPRRHVSIGTKQSPIFALLMTSMA